MTEPANAVIQGILPPPAPPLPPPRAPPLPPERYGTRAANALVRFAQPFLYGSRPPSINENGLEDRALSPGFRGSTRRSNR